MASPVDTVELPDPSEFLERFSLPQARDFEKYFSFEALPYMVVCLYAAPESIPSFSNHLDFDEKLSGTAQATTQAVEWFATLSTELRKNPALKGDPKRRLNVYLTIKHGEPHWADGRNIEFNLPFHAERFFLIDKIAFDEGNRRFYQYQSSNGLWTGISSERLIALSAHYWKRVADDFTDARHRGRAMAKRTTGFLKSLILLGASECRFYSTSKTSILHTQEQMVPIVGKKNRKPTPFSEMFFSRSQIPVRYVGTTRKPEKFLAYLSNVISPDDIEILQHWAGSVLMGVNYHSKILLLTGTGGSGKSSFISIIQGIIGHEASIELHTKGLENRYALGRLVGKNLLLGLDVPLDYLQTEGASHLKKLTGNDLLSPELKGSSKEFRIRGAFNVAITSNARLKLRLQGDAGAWKRRLVHIEFKPKAAIKSDVLFVENLLREEGTQILNWMIVGANCVRHLRDTKRNWPITSDQEERVDNMIMEADSVRTFLNQKVEVSEKKDLTTREVVEGYQDYCNERGWLALPKGVVMRALPALFLELFESKLRTDIHREKTDGSNEILRGYARVQWK